VSIAFFCIFLRVQAFKDPYEGMTQEATAGAIAATMFMGILLQHADTVRHAKPHENDMYSKGALGVLLVVTNVAVVALILIAMLMPLLAKFRNSLMPTEEHAKAHPEAGCETSQVQLELKDVGVQDQTVTQVGVPPNEGNNNAPAQAICCIPE